MAASLIPSVNIPLPFNSHPRYWATSANIALCPLCLSFSINYRAFVRVISFVYLFVKARRNETALLVRFYGSRGRTIAMEVFILLYISAANRTIMIYAILMAENLLQVVSNITNGVTTTHHR